jgi:hypothetical protein
VRRVTFRAGGKPLARDEGAPFAHTLGRATQKRLAGRRVQATADVTRGAAAQVVRRAVLRRCG